MYHFITSQLGWHVDGKIFTIEPTGFDCRLLHQQQQPGIQLPSQYQSPFIGAHRVVKFASLRITTQDRIIAGSGQVKWTFYNVTHTHPLSYYVPRQHNQRAVQFKLECKQRNHFRDKFLQNLNKNDWKLTFSPYFWLSLLFKRWFYV